MKLSSFFPLFLSFLPTMVNSFTLFDGGNLIINSPEININSKLVKYNDIHDISYVSINTETQTYNKNIYENIYVNDNSVVLQYDNTIQASIVYNNNIYNILNDTIVSLKEQAENNPHICGFNNYNYTHKLQGEGLILGVDKWLDCFPGNIKKISMGVATDNGYYIAKNKNISNIYSSIALMFASINYVYKAQVGLFLDVTDIEVRTQLTQEFWNQSPSSGKCTSTIETQLENFSIWVENNKPKRNAMWHLLTNCYPPPGTVGYAWLGTTCVGGHNTGVSTLSKLDWITVAHEIGHTLGAHHTFQNGIGKTGGLMDYCDGKLPCGIGEVQFNTLYNKVEMCNHISQTILENKNSDIQPYCILDYTENLTFSWKSTPELCNCDNLQFITVVCLDSDNKIYNDSKCLLPKPPTQKSCVSTCDNTNWISDEWSKCSVNCGLGTMTRTVKCMKSNMEVNPSLCNEIKPVTIKDCNNVCDNNTYTWNVVKLIGCPCTSLRTVRVLCKNSLGVTYPDSYCKNPKPPTTEWCLIAETCTDTKVQWTTDAWSKCSTRCGFGTQTRNKWCVRQDNPNTLVNWNLCKNLSPPVVSKRCFDFRCNNYEGFNNTNYENFNNTNYESFNRVRSNPNTCQCDGTYPIYCTNNTKNNNYEICDNNLINVACTPTNPLCRYGVQWTSTDWSYCENNIQTRINWCSTKNNTNISVDYNLCTYPPPTSTQAC